MKAHPPTIDLHPLLEHLQLVAPMIVYVYDLRLREHIFVNRPLVEELGYDAETCRRLYNNPLPELMHPDDLRKIPKDNAGLFAAPDGTVIENIARIKSADGTWRRYRSRCSVYSRDEHGVPTAVSGILEDITSSYKMEEHLRQIERVEVVGQMVGAMAHDFNNVLTAILGYSQMLVENLPPGQERLDALEIKAAAERAAELSRRMLDHARTSSSVGNIAVGDVVRQLALLLKRMLPESHHSLKIRTSSEELLVAIDRTDLEQALINLVLNARDAMPDGGTVQLEVEETPGDDRSGGRPMVRLTVKDSGTGMEPQVREHIFDPFFTTKGPGVGTGLGLTSVRRAVDGAGGWIDVDTSPGQGTRFNLLFPRILAPLTSN